MEEITQLTLVIILSAFLISLCTAWSVWSRARKVHRLDALSLWQDFDVDALLALTDVENDSFLRQNLTGSAYLTLRIKRSLLAFRMCGGMLRNANVAIRLAQTSIATESLGAEELKREAVALRSCLIHYRLKILTNLFRAGQMEESELRRHYSRVVEAMNVA